MQWSQQLMKLAISVNDNFYHKNNRMDSIRFKSQNFLLFWGKSKLAELVLKVKTYQDLVDSLGSLKLIKTLRSVLTGYSVTRLKELFENLSRYHLPALCIFQHWLIFRINHELTKHQCFLFRHRMLANLFSCNRAQKLPHKPTPIKHYNSKK